MKPSRPRRKMTIKAVKKPEELERDLSYFLLIRPSGSLIIAFYESNDNLLIPIIMTLFL
jgi:hypothetical protein